jgi:chromosome segregation protein
MYLSSITISGFKSFASKTQIVFAARERDGSETRFGITAVVGPNGSGKSNIADAIRWVMGEQSPKNMRGKKSHDVLFSGSSAKSRSGSASVTLTFDNTDRTFDADYREVSVTRILHRTGEGEYYLNGSRVRLLDVVDFFAAIGVGKESQCVLNQGMADAILSATPDERRAILEEAAGVKPYRIKRDRALRKLDLTRENLTITAGLLEEIEPRLRSLKRQAQRAQQRHDIEERLRVAQLSYYARLWRSLSGERERVQESLAMSGREEKQCERVLDELLEKQRELSQKMQDHSPREALLGEIRTLRRVIAENERTRAHIRGAIDAEIEREKHRRTFDIIPVDLPFVKKRLSGLSSSLEQLVQSLDAMEDIADWKNRRSDAQTILGDIQTLSEECSRSTVHVKRDDEILERERREHERRVAEREEEYRKLTNRIDDDEKKVKEKEVELEQSESDSREFSDAYFALEREISQARSQCESAREQSNAYRVEAARWEAKIEDAEKEIRAELSMPPDSLDGMEIPDTDNVKPEDAEREIGRLKHQLSLIGGIDPLVAQEYAETKERYEFLSTSKDDLEQAMVSLETIIDEMNRRIEKDFSQAFIRINREFNHYFGMLFGGGSASLEKVEPIVREEEDSEETTSVKREKRKGETWGAEIRVSPPSKKVNRLSLLSGGERSLVSLALLFAIIANNPPPFAVLDEVEAALDEANSSRFAQLLRSLSDKTQFIAITHNRETMRSADALYGVTMKQGISKLLSVRMDEQKEEM